MNEEGVDFSVYSDEERDAFRQGTQAIIDNADIIIRLKNNPDFKAFEKMYVEDFFAKQGARAHVARGDKVTDYMMYMQSRAIFKATIDRAENEKTEALADLKALDEVEQAIREQQREDA